MNKPLLTKEERDEVTLMFQALAIVKSLKLKSGVIICPSCGGDLKFAKAPNGHTSGKCKCGINWVE